MRLFPSEADLRADELAQQVDWLEKQAEVVVHFVNKQVSVKVYEQIDGVRVRRCEGIGSTLRQAIQDARKIIQEQDSSKSGKS